MNPVTDQLRMDHLTARFYSELDDDANAAAFDKAAAEGMPASAVPKIYKEMCEIKFVADKYTVLHIGAHEGAQFYRERNARQGYHLTPAQLFPRQYERFKAGLQQVADGISIDELASILSPAKIQQFKEQLNIFTVEALVGLEGTRLANLGPNARTWQRQAAEYLKHAKAASADGVFRHEIEKRDTLIEQMAARLDALERGEKLPPLTAGRAVKASGTGATKPAEQVFTDKHGKPLKGALLAAAKRKAAKAVEKPAPAAKVRVVNKSGDPAELAFRAMGEVDLRNMLTAYSVTLKPGATFDDMVAAAVEANKKAEKGVKATEPMPAE